MCNDTVAKHWRILLQEVVGCLANHFAVGLTATIEEQRVEVAEKNGVVLVLKGMREHTSNPHVQQHACHALAVLASDGMNVLQSQQRA